MKRSIVILADGARADVMRGLVDEGKLPNIARLFYEQGTAIDGVTSFPSTTGPAYLPFLTGCLPGTCNVPGIRWLDKPYFDAGGWSLKKHRSYVGLESFLMGKDIWPHIKTIFELVGDSYSIFNPIARGTSGGRNVTRVMRIWYWYYGHLTDHWAYVDEAGLAKTLGLIKRAPKFAFAVFPGIDEYSHLAHPHHESTMERYDWLDKAIGEIHAELERTANTKSTALWLVSDHGLSKTDHHFCMNTFLKDEGLDPFFYPLIFNTKDKRAASMVSGNGMDHLYFKNSDGWTRHTVRKELEHAAPGLIERLRDKPAIDIVAVRNEHGGIDIVSRRGEASVRLDGDQIHYEVRGSDPFGYDALPVDLTPATSLKLTRDTAYPDAPFQIAHLFTAPRTGDVVVSAVPGHDLRLKYEHPEHHGSHGSLHESHMRVPILCTERFENRPARTVDVFPTVLKMLGEDLPGYIDGLPLLCKEG
jgi:arylsulfatase A-like enzyme